MHMARLAPVLSATSSMVCIWIMARPLLENRLLDDAHEAPALELAQRARRDHLHGVPHAGLVLLVVRHVLLPLAQVLAVLGVLVRALDEERDGLVALGTVHDPL